MTDQPQSIADDLRITAARSPDSIALLFQGVPTTFRQLDEGADRLACGLHKLGVRKGDRVAFAVGNRPVFAAIHYGIVRIGAVSAPLNIGSKAHELRPYLATVNARAIIADEAVVNEVMSAGPHPCPVFVIGKHSSARPFESILSDGQVPDVTISSQDLAVLAHTSGTSGGPKAAMLTHGNLSSNIDQMVAIPSATTEPGDVVLGVLPMFHIYGLNVVLGLSVRQGAAVVLEERFATIATMESVRSNAVTVLVGAPPMFISWLTSPDISHQRLESVRFAVSGASKLAAETIPAFREAFGVEIWEGYGLTETSPTLTTTRMSEQRPGSVGLP
ncbi:MAG: AMP-binding protein, partial [Actinobacteria bacterium]|nr:AMP-binding protein [Actinomycetota bacterium]